MTQQAFGFNIDFPGVIQEIITECGVSVPFKPTPNSKHPQVNKTRGLWDTGASHSVITEDVAKSLGLTPIGKIQSHHAGGTSVVNQYLINIYLPNNVAIPFVLVSECKETIGRFGLLIGMDLINRGDFALSHPNGKSCFSFRMPSMARIDLGKDCLPIEPLQQQAKKTNTSKRDAVVIDPNTPRNAKCPCGSGKKFKHCHGA